ncbi:phage terminase small subunit P27 family [Allorhodopirellula heiligendammensis]|uniref:Phage terminase, small subunit n=1 Tax=Allorhodopirellula heiligendammensis TaxID=2714739 RepID=A0A5C6C5Z0_9BACT|nr:phage terminase small subunit P27 family [Allorhodopirellula heiligendammensis]TWU19545.1 Phage terminase, small subunit [Allorhodopirellula heiligendammensis]
MGKRGPLPKPTARKRLEGNPGHRQLPDDEPEPRTLSEVPDAPGWLPPLACDAWQLVTEELHAVEMLATLDLPILEMWCISYASWREMFNDVTKNGYTQEFFDAEGNLKYSQPTPAATLLGKFASDCNRWAKVLGLGPAYRVGLRIGDGPKSKASAVDPIAAVLAGVGMQGAAVNPPPKKAAGKRAARTVAKSPRKKRKAAATKAKN